MLDYAFLAAITLACGNGADPRLIDAIVMDESGRNPAAISPVNRNGSRDYGWMQISSTNFRRFGLNAQTALDPCRSVDAGSKHLIADGGADAVKPETVDALLHAIAKYNPGDPQKVARVVGIMARNANVPVPAAPTKPKRTLASQFPTFGEK